jgi:CTP-dependent riboflavin kinase
MIFEGVVQLRSSAGQSAHSGPPGESEVMRLNPGRELAIRGATGWQSLSPGSLNLRVDDAVLKELSLLRPQFEEPASGVTYPRGYEHIPKLREAYWYYAAVARNGNAEHSVLVRRAKNPVPRVVELFADVSLRDALNLRPGDIVSVEINAPSRTDA